MMLDIFFVLHSSKERLKKKRFYVLVLYVCTDNWEKRNLHSSITHVPNNGKVIYTREIYCYFLHCPKHFGLTHFFPYAARSQWKDINDELQDDDAFWSQVCSLYTCFGCFFLARLIPQNIIFAENMLSIAHCWFSVICHWLDEIYFAKFVMDYKHKYWNFHTSAGKLFTPVVRVWNSFHQTQRDSQSWCITADWVWGGL